ncbi:DUF3219 family protein [Alkalibacillus silvisoli]|uniref:YkvR family protein n=1 Tax=Alkalibacillus silvisoli TaxID=392823 RepID=A0ABP3JHI1_9BACI
MKVMINNETIEAVTFEEETVDVAGEVKKLIKFDFKVKHEDYHDITTLLYKNDFQVSVPDQSINMNATIYNYSTSLTNLYKEGAIGDFHLELIDK